MKKVIRITILVIILLFTNLVYYVFIGQSNSTRKLARNKELNLYECVSIYQIHTAVWMFGWILSPEAAQQAFIMAFPHRRSIIKCNDFFKKSEMLYRFPIINNRRYLKYPLNDITSTCNLRELRYALALTGGYYQSDWFEGVYHESCTVEAKYDKYVGIYKLGPITLRLNWTLLNYIQGKGWITPFQITYLG